MKSNKIGLGQLGGELFQQSGTLMASFLPRASSVSQRTQETTLVHKSARSLVDIEHPSSEFPIKGRVGRFHFLGKLAFLQNGIGSLKLT